MHSFLGVDVSKAKLDVALLLSSDKFKSKVFANDPQGFAALLKWLNDQLPAGLVELHVCMEATGSYHEALACTLHDQGLKVSVVNPLRVKRFAEAAGLRNKTDATDAKCLARFCKSQTPERWEAPSVAVRALQALVLRLDTLQTMYQAERNRLEVAHASVAVSIEGVIAELGKAIAQVKAQIQRTIDDDPDLRRRAALLDTIPGLGDKTIAQLLAYIGRPERFTSVKALIAYASLAPLVRQSGTSLDKRCGTHPMGHQALKRALYFPAMVAGRHNPLIAPFWNKLKAQGKPGKVIVVACMHKLLAIAYGVLRSGKAFDPEHSKPQSA
ncbi:MAG: IS110 family transposase [Burkholderiaceae bacterium]